MQDFGRLCSDTLSKLTMFESMVEAEFERKSRTPLRPIGEQYRMHPAITMIVSECFYDGKLSTNTKKVNSQALGNANSVDRPFLRGDAADEGQISSR
jgi:superfamily I DNA and/or RNA helicase